MDNFYKHRNFYELITYITILVMFYAVRSFYSPDGSLYKLVAHATTINSHSEAMITPDSISASLRDNSVISEKKLGLIDNAKEVIDFSKSVPTLLIAFLLSRGMFISLSGLLSKLFQRGRRIKSRLLGDWYLEGVWVGYIEEEEKVTFVVEKIKQSYEDIKIDGVSYYQGLSNDLERDSHWKSTVANINTVDSRLEYTYFNRTTLKGEADFTGFASFDFYSYQAAHNEFIKFKQLNFPLQKSFVMLGGLLDFNVKETKKNSFELKISDSLDYDFDFYKEFARDFWLFHKGKTSA